MPETERTGLHLIERNGGGMRLQLVSALGQVFLNECELAFLLGVSHNGLGDGSAQPVGDDGGRAIAFFLGRFAFLLQPRKNIHVQHSREDAGDLSEMLLKQFLRQKPGKFALFKAADKILGRIRKTDEPVACQRRARRHAQSRQDAGISLDDIRRNGGQVFGERKALLYALDGLLAGITIRLGRKLHEPLIELVNRGARIGFPLVCLVCVDGHGLP